MSPAMIEPRAVLISDIHYNINTLEIADAALKQAVAKANELDVRLIIAGDLHDTKAMLRAECIDAILATLRNCNKIPVVLVGNHDLHHEKSKDNSLAFLGDDAYVISEAAIFERIYFLPYYSNNVDLLRDLGKIPPKSLIVAHQGIHGAFMGEYSQDKSSLPPNAFQGHRIISGHYHRHQTLYTGDGGKFTYIGSPYTTNFAEANDGEKGYGILYADDSFELIPTNLRKHIKLERSAQEADKPIPEYNSGDLVWLQVRGLIKELSAIDKKALGDKLGIKDYKLDLIIENSVNTEKNLVDSPLSVGPDVLIDTLIDLIKDSEDHKKYLKELWREVLNAPRKV